MEYSPCNGGVKVKMGGFEVREVREMRGGEGCPRWAARNTAVTCPRKSG